ncbi:hypothetical protein JMJ77_0008234 [Colletotrichum scovillei]|uniref:Uncharacterized protein n=1 Tax=Colletotrichum scovillei TaxID=1209932 RepID=A0A9P7RFK7_9PEZI|nr:hypothetical protein JMJ77_0008234 [Colletotrichum scovillei]KAG7075224.1 hypothetical protein JMJ76_0011685 [Colletotrichum scovillei]KAG7082254.1 hypothetical protein JMJ78_0004357 [Colletotrichum scovillei]
MDPILYLIVMFLAILLFLGESFSHPYVLLPTI